MRGLVLFSPADLPNLLPPASVHLSHSAGTQHGDGYGNTVVDFVTSIYNLCGGKITWAN